MTPQPLVFSDVAVRLEGAVPQPSRKSELLGIPFANVSYDEALALIRQRIHADLSSNLFFVNAHCLNIAYEHTRYRHALRRAGLVLPDGSGIKLGCQLQKDPLQANLNGTDLFPHLCALFEQENTSVYLLGGHPGVAARVAEWIQCHFPALKVAGSQHGYFPAEATAQVISDINRSGAKVLLCAMGVPTQELWLAEHRGQLNTRLNLAVGGLFDFYSDRIARAPLWMRRLGIEWMARLYHEPKRMWRRYLIGNPLYLSRVLKQCVARRSRHHFPQRLFAQPRQWRAALKARLMRWRYRWQLISDSRSKRLTDIVLAGYGLLMLSPIFLLVALAIKLDSPGPVFYSQRRAGLRARPFRMWKFRSMYQDAEARRQELESMNEMADGVTFKVRNDPRVTRVGKFIRRYSIDELPQLFNVLIGEMSVVGPRPALYDELSRYELAQRERLDSVPGLTSPWVISGRSDISFAEQAQLDIGYLRRRSFWLDLKLILKTIPIVLSGKGAC